MSPIVQGSAHSGSDQSGNRLLTADEVAAIIGMRSDYVYALARRRVIPFIRFGRSVRFRRASIESWLETLESGG